MISRRTFLFGLATLGAGGASIPAYARYIEPRWLQRSEHPVRLLRRALPRSLRVLHLSDFHRSRHVSLSFIERAIHAGLAARPDLVILTGDFITGTFDDFDAYRDVLALLSAQAPTFACLGNHDGGSWVYPHGYKNTGRVRRLLHDSGITCLYNEAHPLELEGITLELVGLGDLWAHELDARKAFDGLSSSPQHPRLVLSHNPDSKDALKSYAWDLLLCGHTHGGQLSLPFFGTPFAPVHDHRFVEGLHEWEGRLVYITRGVGNLRGLRFNCRPEVSVLELRETSNAERPTLNNQFPPDT